MSKDASLWLDAIQHQIERAASTLFTTAEFGQLLNSLVSRADCPLSYLVLNIDQEKPFERTCILDSRSVTSAHQDETSKPPLGESGNAICNIAYKRAPDFDRNDIAQALKKIEELTSAFWADNMRDLKSRLRANQNPSDERIIQNTIERWVRENRVIHFFFADLDKFKRINDELNEKTGDRVILEVAAILQKTSAEKTVPIHRSGDEFWLLVPDLTTEECLNLARSVDVEIKKHDFDVGEIPVGISMGIAKISNEEVAQGVSSFEHLAEKAVKLPGGSGKERGTARLRGEPSSSSKAMNVETLAESLCLAKSNLSGDLPFYSPWLNLIASETEKHLLSNGGDHRNLQGVFDSLVQWIRPKWQSSSAGSSICEYNPSPEFSAVDALFASACGIFRYGFSNLFLQNAKFEIRRADTCVQLSVDSFESPLLRIADDSSVDLPFDLGTILSGQSAEGTANRCTCRQAILIHVGHVVEPALKPLFADVVSVDDRPTKGGELRDFWEATVARLIAGVLRCHATRFVFFMGDEKYAAETARRLRMSNLWSQETSLLAIKTGMPPHSIALASEKIRNNVKFVKDRSQLFQEYAAILRQPRDLTCHEDIASSYLDTRSPVLTRTLNSRPFQLSISDGFTVSTIAQAFPLAIEILRTSDRQVVKDQAGMLLREVSDFKVKIENPSDDRLPTFYDGETKSFDEYFERAFKSNDSLFGSRITDQWVVVKEQLEELLRQFPNITTTRRAILVVPYNIKSVQDPLGLICVRISPKLIDGKAVLDFSFVWRTVEALTGFPYSIYGSARFAKSLCDEIKDTLSSQLRGHVDLGELTYIAMSLHMFVDEYGQNIAKRIVDDASF